MRELIERMEEKGKDRFYFDDHEKETVAAMNDIAKAMKSARWKRRKARRSGELHEKVWEKDGKIFHIAFWKKPTVLMASGISEGNGPIKDFMEMSNIDFDDRGPFVSKSEGAKYLSMIKGLVSQVRKMA